MIGAQTDQAVQEHLIEKYMLLPNQVWDSIIQQATKVRHTLFFLRCAQGSDSCTARITSRNIPTLPILGKDLLCNIPACNMQRV